MIQDNSESSATNREAEEALVRKAYDRNNPKREEDRNRLMKYIYGTYEKELSGRARNILFRNKYLDTPDDILMGFIKKKLLEEDALAGFHFKCRLKTYLFKLLRNYFISEYLRKTPQSETPPLLQQSINKEMVENYDSPAVIKEQTSPYNNKDIMIELIPQFFRLAFSKLSKENPLDAKLLIEYCSEKILHKDMKNNPDDDVIKEAAVTEEIPYNSPEAAKACKKKRKQLTDRLLKVKENLRKSMTQLAVEKMYITKDPIMKETCREICKQIQKIVFNFNTVCLLLATYNNRRPK